MSTCFYKNTTIRVTKANNITSDNTNLQIYFNHVVYGTFIQLNTNIRIKLVGPTTENIPYIPWNNIATDSYTDSSVIRFNIGVNTPATIQYISTFNKHPSNTSNEEIP